MTYEDEGGDWGKASTSQGIATPACKLPEARREAWKRFLLTACRGNLHDCETISLLFKAPSL